MKATCEELSNGSLSHACRFLTGTVARSSSASPEHQVRSFQLPTERSSVHLHYTGPRPLRRREIQQQQALYQQDKRMHSASTDLQKDVQTIPKSRNYRCTRNFYLDEQSPAIPTLKTKTYFAVHQVQGPINMALKAPFGYILK